LTTQVQPGWGKANQGFGGVRLFAKIEGLSISRAVELWRQLEAEGQSPFGQPSFPGSLAAKPSIAVTSGQTLEQLRDDWVDACLGFDEQTAERILTQAFALYPPEVTIASTNGLRGSRFERQTR
jgi:hypothetical protein